MFKSLMKSSPLLVSKDAVDLLWSPTEFYNQILVMLKKSNKRVVFSALYLGNGNQEMKLLDEIDIALSDKNKPDLKISFILDYSRATRKKDGSIESVSKLVKKYPERFEVCLYQMPQLRVAVDTPLTLQYFPSLTRLLPTPADEVLGVYHCKYCLFDNNVILTGANLSKDYFTDRQDRYMVINSDDKQFSGSVPEFLFKFSEIVMKYCYRVTVNNNTPHLMIPKIIDSKLLVKDVERLTTDVNISSVGSESDSISFYPLAQHGPLRLLQESEVLPNLLNPTNHIDSLERIVITSPYPSFRRELASAFISALSRSAVVDIVLPSSFTHGFASGKGLKALVPSIHQYIFRNQFYDIVCKKAAELGKVENVRLWSYRRDNWTFHSKGIWFYSRQPSDCNRNMHGDLNNPAATYIGSSNMGERSWGADFELGFLVTVPRDSQLSRAFGKECYQLLSSSVLESKPVEDNTFPRWLIAGISSILKSLL